MIRSEPRLESANHPPERNGALQRVPAVVCAHRILTWPTLLSRWEKLGRGGTEDEAVKLLDGIQRV